MENNRNRVNISKGNSKMGAIPSVSLPSIVTCRECGCMQKCYARKLERIRPNVRDAYKRNLDLLQSDPDEYWKGVYTAIATNRFFRFHVSGDIPDAEYFRRVVGVSKANPKCEVLMFTKKFEIVNGYIAEHGGDYHKALPDNLHVIFSGWVGLEMENPYRLPEAHVEFRDGTTTARPDAHKCGGNCTMCSVTGTGCWVLKEGEQVVFHEH